MSELQRTRNVFNGQFTFGIGIYFAAEIGL